jgi:hypothetical protein
LAPLGYTHWGVAYAKFHKAHTLGNEMWSEVIKNFEILDVQPHMLLNFKFYMPLCFIVMLFIPFLNLLQELISLGV